MSHFFIFHPYISVRSNNVLTHDGDVMKKTAADVCILPFNPYSIMTRAAVIKGGILCYSRF